jgi:quinoprotein glucose dehydrogenase
MRDAKADRRQTDLRLAMLMLAAAMSWSAAGAQAQTWSVYGGDAAGTRYSAATEITKANVAKLRVVWTYHTGDAARHGAAFTRSSFEVTPILASGKLVFCTPFDCVIALDATSGDELWMFDPVLPTDLHPADDAVCRGVAVWHDATVAAETACANRVFLGTNDARLIALDLATGKPCAGFGSNGEITLPPDVPPLYQGELHIDSAPTLVNDVVVVGSAVDDMSRARAPSGTVFAFDPRTGQKRWSFDPVPRRPDDPAAASWANGSYARSAGGSVWAPMSADPARDLIFLPTAGPTAAFYGGERPGDDLYTSSVVALRASTGQVVWPCCPSPCLPRPAIAAQ